MLNHVWHFLVTILLIWVFFLCHSHKLLQTFFISNVIFPNALMFEDVPGSLFRYLSDDSFLGCRGLPIIPSKLTSTQLFSTFSLTCAWPNCIFCTHPIICLSPPPSQLDPLLLLFLVHIHSDNRLLHTCPVWPPKCPPLPCCPGSRKTEVQWFSRNPFPHLPLLGKPKCKFPKNSLIL